MKGRLLPIIELGNRMKRYKINEMTFNNLTVFLSIVQINDFFHKFSCYQNDDNTKQIHWRQFLFGRTSNNWLLTLAHSDELF